MPCRVALDTKTRDFHDKLLKRCLVINTLLCEIGVIPSPACSLWWIGWIPWTSFSVLSVRTKNFLDEVINWLVDYKVKVENLLDKDRLFGIIGCDKEIFCESYFILAKQYIYTLVDRLNKYSPSIIVLHSIINTIFLSR